MPLFANNLNLKSLAIVIHSWRSLNNLRRDQAQAQNLKFRFQIAIQCCGNKIKEMSNVEIEHDSDY